MDVPGVFQVDERPEIFIPSQDDMATATAIAAIGTAFHGQLIAVKMLRSRAAFS
jgi:hypothetical protein